MHYLDCPRCRARFHAGVIYYRLERCPRCDASLDGARPRIGKLLRSALGRRGLADAPDWETITSSQYLSRRPG